MGIGRQLSRNRAAKHILSNQKGVGLTSVLIAMGVLVVVSYYAMNGMVSSRQQMVTLNSVEGCQQQATDIISDIKSFDNALTIRTWLPTSSISRIAANSDGGVGGFTVNVPGEPFCSNAGRTAVCDTFGIINQGPIVNTANILNTQNIRGSATWAQSVYNRYVPAICSLDGNQQPLGYYLDRAQFQSILPRVTTIPTWVQGVRLYIREYGAGALGCVPGVFSTSGVNSNRGFEVRVKLLKDPSSRNPGGCEAVGRVDFQRDLTPSVLTVNVTNGNNVPIPYIAPPALAACTCQRLFEDVLINGCPEAFTVNTHMQSSEPGTVLVCRRDGPLAQVSGWMSCGDLGYNGSNRSFSPDRRVTAVLNTGIDTTLTLSSIPPNSVNTDPYGLSVQDVDIGGNLSNLASSRYRIKTPWCPPANTYCPGATNATPPPSINHRPIDDCGNGLCPVGTRARQNCPRPANTFCPQIFDPDDCGNPTCQGSRRAQNCGLPANFCVNQRVTDDCGNDECGQWGTNPGSCRPNSEIPCGTFEPNSCGLGSCGPGTNNCPATNALCTCGDTSFLGCGDMQADVCIDPFNCPPGVCGQLTCGPGVFGCCVPTCPDPSTFPATTWVYDSCGNLSCGPGTAPWVGPTTGSPPPTGGGPGSSGGSCIADNDQCGDMGYECGDTSNDNCDQCCSGNGWYQFDSGYAPWNIPCPGSCMLTEKHRFYYCKPLAGAPPDPAPGPTQCQPPRTTTGTPTTTTGGPCVPTATCADVDSFCGDPVLAGNPADDGCLIDGPTHICPDGTNCPITPPSCPPGQYYLPPSPPPFIGCIGTCASDGSCETDRVSAGGDCYYNQPYSCPPPLN